MEFRTADLSDFNAIRALFWELDSTSIAQQPEHFQRGERSDEYLTELVENEDSDFVLCVEDGEIVGFSLIFMRETPKLNLLVPGRYAHIQDFVIGEGHRNKGLGTALMNASKQWAAERSAQFLRLTVIPTNEAGIRFYERNGLHPQMISMECSLTE